MSNFSCPRTCPMFSGRWCRFRPVLDQLGPVKVSSHTATIKVEFRDPRTLRAAVEAIGGQWLGQGQHHLYGGDETGIGFRLPKWQYPLVARADGTLAYDDFSGTWGEVADLDRLKSEYAVQTAQQAATQQGWLTERTNEGLLIHHPSGGSLLVAANGSIDLNGFQGQGCHEALLDLGIHLENVQAKREFGEVVASAQEVAP